MPAGRAIAAWSVIAFTLVAGLIAWTRFENDDREPRGSAVVFTTRWRGCPILVPNAATSGERAAAAMLAETLAKAAGTSPEAFPILGEAESEGRRGIFVGATERARGDWPTREPAPFDTGVTYRVQDGEVVISSEARGSIGVAVAWFADRVLGAQWFMPGELDEEIPRRKKLVLKEGRSSARPGFISRDLSGLTRPEERRWYGANRFELRIGHGHSYDKVFSPETLRANPKLAPVINGARYFPEGRDYEWQPNIANPAAATHAAQVIATTWASDASKRWFSLCINDSMRFDTSAETQERVLPLHYFRHRPDFSDLIFGFTNEVARKVAVSHPDRFITAYAYFWAENMPSFPVQPNVVPILTADRSQWFDPAFAAEDQRLIRRWCESGAKLVGVYDYFYGAPFLVPRPTLYAVRQSIPFEHQAGVRSFYAEAQPNWALDGPKLWLAAKLLWTPTQSAQELLDTYYREFWREVAVPMRRFSSWPRRHGKLNRGPATGSNITAMNTKSRCIHPSGLRRCGLRWTTPKTARTPRVRDRVRFVDEGFRVTEALAGLCAARDRVARAVEYREISPAELLREWRMFASARRHLREQYARVRHEEPLAIKQPNLNRVLRSDPSARVEHRLRREGAAEAADEVARASEVGEAAAGEERLRDKGWATLVVRPPVPPYGYRWTANGAPWVGVTEPAEGRRLTAELSGQDGKRLRFSRCLQDSLRQSATVQSEDRCEAAVDARARVSPGNETSLGVFFIGTKGELVGSEHTDRLPIGETANTVRLRVVARAPAGAKRVVFALNVTHQVGDDFAEFAGATLRTGP